MRGHPSDKPRPSGVGRGKGGTKRSKASPPRRDRSPKDSLSDSADDNVPLQQRALALEAAGAEDPPRTPRTRSQGPAVLPTRVAGAQASLFFILLDVKVTEA